MNGVDIDMRENDLVFNVSANVTKMLTKANLSIPSNDWRHLEKVLSITVEKDSLDLIVKRSKVSDFF